MAYTLVLSTTQKEYLLDTLPEFPGEDNIEHFSHPALKVYEDKGVEFYLDKKDLLSIWDENMTFVGRVELIDVDEGKVDKLTDMWGDGMYIVKDYEPDDDDECSDIEELSECEDEMDDVDKELEEIAKLEKQLAARKKAAKERRKKDQRKTEARWRLRQRKRAAFEEATQCSQ